ncbi:MAG: FAD/NAD(P)-binding protein, partial [Brachybacterium sp.]|nr:FAD/NAD(P)-binding protein [Brachybacterium sp.]
MPELHEYPPHARSGGAAGQAPSSRSVRLVVIGAGPKALFALEELAAQFETNKPRSAEDQHGPLEVTVIDPGAEPGTGAAYATDQSPLLRLNVTASILDAPATDDAPGFRTWAREHAPEAAEEHYPPRAVVGRYLTERWRAMETSLRAHATIRRHRARATAIRPDGAGFRVAVESAGEGTPASWELPADDVLVATGHAPDHDGALHHT